MSFPIRCLQQLLYEIQKWPGFGPRSAQKLVIHLLKRKESDLAPLISAMKQIETKIHQCQKCFGWTESESACSICDDPSRDQGSMCIVENPFDIFRIEKSNVFNGYYHVLHGMISPLQNISPEDLTISSLQKKVRNKEIKELILALDTSLEGDTTSLYIAKIFESMSVKVSKLALGIPQGSHLDFIDDQTLSQAIENRMEI